MVCHTVDGFHILRTEHLDSTQCDGATAAAFIDHLGYLVIAHGVSYQFRNARRHTYLAIELLHGLDAAQSRLIGMCVIVGDTHDINGKLYKAARMTRHDIACP